MPDRHESITVLTLDAGGTHFVFSAMHDGKPLEPSISLDACTDDLDRCIEMLIDGFEQLRETVGQPDAISFAFPGPADYAHGVIGDLPNFPAFHGGVPLGPILERHFSVPVHINNDGCLFALGESLGGLLPEINTALERRGSSRRYRNLIGITLGTGLGGGLVVDGRLIRGDTDLGGEMWLLRNKHLRGACAMESVGRDALRRLFSERAGLEPGAGPSPAEIAAIADHPAASTHRAAQEAFTDFGETLGAAIGDAIALIDGLVVLGGGLAAAHRHFMPAVLDELRSSFTGKLYGGTPRLAQRVLNLDDTEEREQFLDTGEAACRIPGTDDTVSYCKSPILGIGRSRLGTNQAIALGAYAVAATSRCWRQIPSAPTPTAIRTRAR